MEPLGTFLYYLGVTLPTMLAAIGVAIGQGVAGGGSASGQSRQTLAQPPIQQATLVGLGVLETGGVFALVISILFLFNVPFPPTVPLGIAMCGIGFGMGFSACMVGLFTGRVILAATAAMARQPLEAKKVSTFMMLAQMLMEAPAVFSFIICFLVRSKMVPDMTIAQGIQYAVGGLILGFASIGPVIGQSLFATRACESIGTNVELFPRIFSFAFVVQAIIETPVIFGLLLSLSMVLLVSGNHLPFYDFISALIGVNLAFGLGSIGAGIGSGFVASRAVRGMVNDPDQYPALFRTTLVCQGVIDTALIYSVVIAFFLLKPCM